MPIYHQQPANDSPELVERRPYQSFALGLLRFGPIALYCSQEILEADIQKLEAESFEVRRMDTTNWGRGVNAFEDLQRVLQLPAYFGKNFDALHDCMSDLVMPDHGGLAIVLTNYDDFAAPRKTRELARCLLDVMVGGSRLLQLFGKTLVILVHSKDPDIDLGKLGAVAAHWNRHEFVRQDRGNPSPADGPTQ